MGLMEQILHLINEMSPFLLLGFLLAGLMHAFIPGQIYSRYLAKPTFSSVLYSALFGIPLPLCSCGVIPTAMSLRKEGASKGAVASFLIATPQTGVDSIIATYSLMGLPFAIARPIIAFVTALFGGQMVNMAEQNQSPLLTSPLYYYVIFSFQYFSFSNTTYLPSIPTMPLWRYSSNFYVILTEKRYLQQRCTYIYIPLYPEIKNKGKYGTNTTSHQRNVSFPIIRIPPCRTYARVHTWADIQPISCKANIQQCTLFRPLRHPSPTLLLRSDSNGYVTSQGRGKQGGCIFIPHSNTTDRRGLNHSHLFAHGTSFRHSSPNHSIRDGIVRRPDGEYGGQRPLPSPPEGGRGKSA